MKTVISIPIDLYSKLMERCDRSSREYENMVNGWIRGEILSIHCDRQGATDLVSWADDCVPGASKKIKVVHEI